MPFVGINPPTNRVAGIVGGGSNASMGSAPLNNIVDGTALNLVGIPAWYKDFGGRISVLAYAQAMASIVFGAGLVKQVGDATTFNSAGASTSVDTGFVRQGSSGATHSILGYKFGGIAAASVVNTGHFFWRYISGYVPFAKVGSAIGSGAALCPFPSTAGVLGTPPALNATATNATVACIVGYTLNTTDAADGSMSSIWLSGWYM